MPHMPFRRSGRRLRWPRSPNNPPPWSLSPGQVQDPQRWRWSCVLCQRHRKGFPFSSGIRSFRQTGAGHQIRLFFRLKACGCRPDGPRPRRFYPSEGRTPDAAPSWVPQPRGLRRDDRLFYLFFQSGTGGSPAQAPDIGLLSVFWCPKTVLYDQAACFQTTPLHILYSD